jgi:hypothetical protein
VEVFRYVTEGSFDSYMWQTLETKARFIAQVMKGDQGIRSLEDVELAALSYAEVKALASGNPLVIEKPAWTRRWPSSRRCSRCGATSAMPTKAKWAGCR